MLRTMKTRVARGRYGKDEGFTLIELMVVVLIIAILLAIAIPTFLGAQNRAKDRAAQSSLRNTLAAAKAMYTDTQDFSTATVANLTAAEPNITFNSTGSTGPNVISVYNSASVFTVSALSKTGTCFSIKEDLTNGAAVGTKYEKVATAATCKADAATTATLANW